MTAFEQGKEAFAAGKSETDNPFIIGFTKLGNPRLSEDGIEWSNGFRSCIARTATKEEMAQAAKVDISRFRRKSNRFYR